MSGDIFTDQGLADRSRVFPPDLTAQQIPVLQVERLVIGGVELYAKQGTRYKNGRLMLKGRGDNSIELEMAPGDACQSKGVIAQLIMYAKHAATYFRRFGISIVDDGENERVEVDSSAHESTYAMPVYMPVMGARSRSDGSDVPDTAKYSFAYFQDGSHELYLFDQTIRVGLASVIEAWLTNDRSRIVARDKAGNQVQL